MAPSGLLSFSATTLAASPRTGTSPSIQCQRRTAARRVLPSAPTATSGSPKRAAIRSVASFLARRLTERAARVHQQHPGESEHCFMYDGVIAAPKRRLSADFWKFWTGQTISNLGNSVTLFALPLLVYKLTGSALNLGLQSAAEMLPYLLFGLLLGALMDRVDRKRIMILTDIARGAVIATIPLMFALGHLSVWWIYGVGFLHSTLTICFEAGQFAAIPNLVDQDDLVTANGRIQASYSGASILGPVVAGLMVAFLPLASLLLLDSLSFLVSALSLVLVTISFNASRDPQSERKHILQDVREGLSYVLHHPVLRNISLMMALVNFVDTTVMAQLVLFAKVRLLASDTQIGLLFTAGSFGVVVLSLLAGVFRKRWTFSRV